MSQTDSFGARSDLEVGGRTYEIFRLDSLADRFDVARLPYSIKVLLENVLRLEDGVSASAADVEAIAGWDPAAEPSDEIPYQPARVLMQDFTGVPAVVDLAAMRDAMAEIGGDPEKINPLVDVDLVIDHSVQVDAFGNERAFATNAEREFERNRERYSFLKWGREAFDNFSVVPPATGICHQVNLEHISQVVYSSERAGTLQAYPDTLVGTDSHTTMVNGLGVLGWGVGGIEAEAAMLGQPVSMLLPQVVGFKLGGELPQGATATDLVLTVTEMLRRHGVVSKFVEFFGPGLSTLGLADRATIGNMSPEFGSTCAIFPIDAETLRYLELTGRPTERLELVDAYAREQGMFHDADGPDPAFSATLELDLGEVVPSIAGPKRPQDRVPLAEAKQAFLTAMEEFDPEAGAQLGNSVDEAIEQSFPASDPPAEEHEDERGQPRPAISGAPVAVHPHGSDDAIEVTLDDGSSFELDHGRVVIAAITSCTNTSNPSVMVGAGLLARNAVERGLERRPWVKTSLAPGSTVVTDYLDKAGLDRVPGPPPVQPRRLRLHDLHRQLRAAAGRDLGRCRGEGPRGLRGPLRQPQLRGAHQPGREGELPGEPAAGRRLRPRGADGPRPDQRAARRGLRRRAGLPARHLARPGRDQGAGRQLDRLGDVHPQLRRRDGGRRDLEGGRGPGGRPLHLARLHLRAPALVLRRDAGRPPRRRADRRRQGARPARRLDHHRPHLAGRRDQEGQPGRALAVEQGVEPGDFNSYGSRRGNHEVMIRGTFANIRLQNLLVEKRGGFTRRFPDGGAESAIFDAAMAYAEEGVPLVVLAGKEYGSGSSRDWAAKGTKLLGVRAVIAESFERIHRSNLIGMGVLPAAVPGRREHRLAGPDRRGDLRLRRPRRRRGRARSPSSPAATAPATSSSTRSSASILPTRSPTSTTAASCRRSSGTCGAET